ncbi:hypothetical protein F5B22DRAFT_595021 [Xylaria bambusicola]|uniref:uncharacterized protein n=1 Tax=Xylaria bambusicola TaxID=326684 RepID=UPI0020088133|nr:uncharacterized protein F5B22DRAFT_595021 [Xylaria bambusicola]KAI0522022.1 hypothetical protein F5B22DRAFT_595021 [Xylaria bambusicola]
MAFHQPTRQAAQRVFRPAPESDIAQHVQVPAVQPTDESQTWVLFSPATDAGTTSSYLTSTHRSNITRRHSRSDVFGSLDTIAPSEASAAHHRTDSFLDFAEDEDDAELDSLDNHLPEFRSTPDFYVSSTALPHTDPVFPNHDGLGLFQLEQEGMGEDVQNRLYAFEQYNPRRIKRRRESLNLAQAELEKESNQERDKINRIESWRLEHSRYLLEEIQKETRRRRRSVSTASNVHHIDHSAENATGAAAGGLREENADESWHDQNMNDCHEKRESIWTHVTRKVVQDLLGIDDKMLSVLFGEELPDEEELSTTPRASALPSSNRDDKMSLDAAPDSSWQSKMLERVAKELGLLVHHLSDHPGAFTTFSKVQQMPIPYAGLPAIPESASHLVSDGTARENHMALPEFQPTITTSRPIDIPQARHPPETAHSKSQLQADSNIAFTQEEWEQDLDIRLVFRYLRTRFFPRSSSNSTLSGASHMTGPTSGTQDAAAMAARVRQHHPLVSRPRNAERRKSKATTMSSAALHKPVSSCASQSTRRSVRRSSCSSSRHYWDIGGSVGTGSMIATTGPMGSWGEI